MYCRNCRAKLRDGVNFCDHYGSGGKLDEIDITKITIQDSPKTTSSFAIAMVIVTCAVGATLFGGIALVIGSMSSGGESDMNERQASSAEAIQEDSDSPTNASLVVYSSYGSQMSEYDVTLNSESGESLAYHVNDAWGGVVLSDLGVEDGTYDVIVTNH